MQPATLKQKYENRKHKNIRRTKSCRIPIETIKEELCNLTRQNKNRKTYFEGVHGFENTVIPELERAIYLKAARKTHKDNDNFFVT
jgi:hypothetical protein